MRVLMFLALGFAFSAGALVDTKSGNYKKTFVDFDLKGLCFLWLWRGLTTPGLCIGGCLAWDGVQT